jgi:hypothetical protein
MRSPGITAQVRLPARQKKDFSCRYTIETPSVDWVKPSFSDVNWQTG